MDTATERSCLGCGARLSKPKDKRLKYCTRKCAIETFAKTQPRGAYPGIPCGTVGAISELRVSFDLMQRGFHVFRALSPSCPCDLAALVNGKLVRFEVKTGYRSKNGNVQAPACKPGAFDVLAICLPGEIIYRPPLDAFGTI